MPSSAIVLCGGQSSRMGRAKAWLPWRGRPVLAHVVRVLREVVDDVVVVAAGDQDVPAVEARIVRDREPGLGPLAGIAVGLAHAEGKLAYVTATDAPHLTAAFVRSLLGFGSAAAPEIDGIVQTLSAVYPTDAAVTADAVLAAGRRRPLDLLGAVDFRRVAADELPDLQSILGFNTPDAYLAAVRRAEPGAEAVLELAGRAAEVADPRLRKVPVGSLAAILAEVAEGVELVEGDRVAKAFAITLDRRCRLRDPRAPVGPGEHLLVHDAPVEG